MIGSGVLGPARTRRSAAARSRLGLIVIYAVLLAMAGATLLPLYLMLVTSIKNNPEFYRSIFGIVFPLHWENYGLAWGQISPYILNSIIITGASVIGVIVLAALAAYAFARLSFPGKEILFYMVIALLMLPGILTLVPSFIIVRNFGLLDSRWALILPYISSGVVFATFVLRSFFAGISEELFEAARIDGAGELRVFWHLGLPLIRPAVTTVAVLQILSTWNDYLWPLVVLFSDNKFTLTIGLYSFSGRYAMFWGPLMAGYTLASVPLVLLFALSTRTFISGMTQGGLKL